MLKILAVGLSLFFGVATAVAAGFQLNAIGALDVTGTMSREWWYTSPNPVLSGETADGAAVTVTIDGQEYQAVVDGSGWSYAPTTLAEGDHEVGLTSSGGSQSFTLHIGAVPADVTAPVQQSTPVAGTTEQTLALWLGGLIILAGGTALAVKHKWTI